MKRIRLGHGELALERVQRRTDRGMAVGKAFFLAAAIAHFLLHLFLLGSSLVGDLGINSFYESGFGAIGRVPFFFLLFLGPLVVYCTGRAQVKQRKSNSYAFPLYRLWGVTAMAYPLVVLLTVLIPLFETLPFLFDWIYILFVPLEFMSGMSIVYALFVIVLFITGLLTGRRWAKILAIFGVGLIAAATVADQQLAMQYMYDFVPYYNLFSQCAHFIIPIGYFCLWISLKRGYRPKEKEKETFDYEEVITK